MESTVAVARPAVLHHGVLEGIRANEPFLAQKEDFSRKIASPLSVALLDGHMFEEKKTT
jgi:hypothetical protein